MSMKVSEFIEWLKTQDQEADVKVVEKRAGRDYQGDYVVEVDFDPEENAYYIDMRGNQFAVGKPYENSRTLTLGLL
jgi:hypothetical protein